MVDGDYVVVGIDGSPRSDVALLVAAGEARAHQVPLHVVLAWSPVDLPEEPGMPEVDPSFTRERATAWLSEHVERVLGSDPGFSVVPKPVNDLPVRALTEAAKGARMLVLGARGGGRRNLFDRVLGTVSEHFVHDSTCPLMLVPHPHDRPA